MYILLPVRHPDPDPERLALEAAAPAVLVLASPNFDLMGRQLDAFIDRGIWDPSFPQSIVN